MYTSRFLPPYLNTNTNQKFLKSTLDLLTKEPVINRFNGYVGRSVVDNAVLDGYYLGEITAPRQNYQLEPAFVTRDADSVITSVSNFIDVVNSAAANEAATSAWDRLLSSNYYKWNGFIDQDKLTNYSNYIWISKASDSWYWNYPILIQTVASADIIGNATYTSGSITLANGMFISCSDGSFIVDGVGSYITLLAYSDLVDPIIVKEENYEADYITISRTSTDKNFWSLTNFWVHRNVVDTILSIIQQQYSDVALPTSFNVAVRPIIEFAPMMLVDSNQIGLTPISLFDNYTPNAFSIVEGTAVPFMCDGVELKNGHTIIFNNDQSHIVRNNIYRVEVDSNEKYHLVLEATATTDNCVSVVNGDTFGGGSVSWNGNTWIVSPQAKTKLQQSPLFDLYDSNGVSLRGYTHSTFSGCKLFSYQTGSGSADEIIETPLSYGLIGNLNDVVFSVDYHVDTFAYDGVKSAVAVSTAKPMYLNPNKSALTVYNPWEYVDQSGQLYQQKIIANTATSIITLPNATITSSDNVSVYVNGTSVSFTFTQSSSKAVLTLSTALTTSDTAVVRAISSTPITGAWYDVPVAFENNQFNTSFTTLNISEIQKGKLLKNESFAYLTTLLMCDSRFDIDKAIRTAASEYQLFKNRFLNKMNSMQNAILKTPHDVVDSILESLATNVLAGNTSWYNSDMCGYGGTKTTHNITKFDHKNFPLSKSYDFTTANFTAVLVYLNDVQLTKGTDYTIADYVLNVTCTLAAGDKLVVYEISSTKGSYIPSTPTKLGLAPAYKPEIFTDDTYTDPRMVLRGHDGSITTCFNDYRDQVLLDYELRVYNNLKVDNQLLSNAIQTFVPDPGYWRSSKYTQSEFNGILSRMYYEWIADYNVTDAGNYFDANNYFTWNWSSSKDKLSGNSLIGYWRGIYNYFYGTDSVHLRPWEMLNLSEKPSWWDDVYGPAPYTAGNTILWQDIADGIVRDPSGSYTSVVGTKPELLSILPVDDSGNVLTPNDVMVGTYDESAASNAFVFGDQGPVETAWRRSSAFQFAMLRARILMNPMFMIGMLWDTCGYLPSDDSKQFLYSNRIANISDIPTDSTKHGILAYSYEYLLHQNRDITLLSKALSQTTAQLMYSIGGFTSVSDVAAYATPNNPSDTGAAELIPDEDFDLFLYNSTPVGTLNYSGVIVRQTDDGFVISGYNNTHPYFSIYAANVDGPYKTVTIGNDKFKYPTTFASSSSAIAYNTTFATKQSVLNFLAGYEKFLTTNGVIFNLQNDQAKTTWCESGVLFIKWALTASQQLTLVLNPAASIFEYTATSGSLSDLTDPNISTVLDASGKVVDSQFLEVIREGNNVTIMHLGGGVISCVDAPITNYEHRLVFDNTTAFSDVIYDPIAGIRQNRIKLSGQRSGDWDGTINSAGFIITTNTVDSWESNTDYVMGSLVKYKNNNYIATQDVIGAATFQSSYFQQISTTFSNGILPNLSLKIKDCFNAYDVNYRPIITDLLTLRNNTLGYIERDWLMGLDIDASAQVEYYCGWVKEKGTLNAVTNYGYGSTDALNTAITITEEYAVKVGTYGSDSRTGFCDVSLSPAIIKNDPITISFTPTVNSNSNVSIQVPTASLYEKSSNWDENFVQQYGNLETNFKPFRAAGPVIPDWLSAYNSNIVPGFDVTTDSADTMFMNYDAMINSSNTTSLVKIAKSKGLFWIASDPTIEDTDQWNVISFTPVEAGVAGVTANGNVTSLMLTANIATAENRLVALDLTDANVNIQGIFKVTDYSVSPTNLGNIQYYSVLSFQNSNTASTAWFSDPVAMGGVMVSTDLRYDNIAAINPAEVVGNSVYVNNDEYGTAEYELVVPYSAGYDVFPQVDSTITTAIDYDMDSLLVWEGKPYTEYNSTLGVNRGLIQMRHLKEHTDSNGNTYPVYANVSHYASFITMDTTNLGEQLVVANGFVVASANNTSSTGNAMLYVATYSSNTAPAIQQVLSCPGIKHIEALCMSEDARYLYASGSGQLIQGVLKENSSYTSAYHVASVTSNSIVVTPSTLVEAEGINILVTDSASSETLMMKAGVDYTVANGNTITVLTSGWNLTSSQTSVNVNGNEYYYKLFTNINYGGRLYSSSTFGKSLSCDTAGKTVALGDPSNGTGKVIIFNRIYEKQLITASTKTVSINIILPTVNKVMIDGVLVASTSYAPVISNGLVSSITFTNTIAGGSTVEIHGPRLAFSQEIDAPTSSDSEFGSSVSIRNNMLVVGSANATDNGKVGGGLVHMFAMDSSITTQKIVPTSRATGMIGASQVWVNGWIINRSGSNLTTLISDINAYTSKTGISVVLSGINLLFSIDQTKQEYGIASIL